VAVREASANGNGRAPRSAPLDRQRARAIPIIGPSPGEIPRPRRGDARSLARVDKALRARRRGPADEWEAGGTDACFARLRRL
jgi:hypothetical protein